MKSIPNLDWDVLSKNILKQSREYGWRAMLLRSKSARAMAVLSRMMERPEIVKMQQEGYPIEEVQKKSQELWYDVEKELIDELRKGITLEDQLAQAIIEERYEDAQKIKEQLSVLERATK